MSLQRNRQQQVFGPPADPEEPLQDPAVLARLLAECHRGQTVVFTNGCFDLIHRGHVEYLEQARALGDVLVVALNSDESVRRIKGPERPLMPLADRAAVVAALASVDYVTFFDEPTPLEIVRALPVQVLVKGGDWPEELVVGADIVRQRGGRVACLTSGAPDLSTSAILARIRNGHDSARPAVAHGEALDALGVLASEIDHCLAVHGQILDHCGEAFVRAAGLLGQALRGGGSVYAFGNGGSAADSHHFVAELVGRFRADRGPLPAVSLVADCSVLTAVGNDFGFEEIFARQVAARVRPGDVVLGISTSGGSRNVLNGLMRAREHGAWTIGLTGGQGRQMAGICDVAIQVPATDTARIQEVHALILHCLVDVLERCQT
jgi:D-sedoheptulose 7-phosphate isomerase